MKKNSMTNILEAIVTLVILLVVIHTFLEDFAVLSRWSQQASTVLLIAGFFFDLFFTLEFLIRLGFAFVEGRGGEYFLHKKGWIDFLASVPLLILNSGPVFAMLILGGGVVAGAGGILSILKLIKAIRIARVLRLLRVLKIFKNIKYTNSKMAQRHVAKIITIGVTALVFSLFLTSGLAELLDVTESNRSLAQQQQTLLEIASNRQKSPRELSSLAASLELLAKVNPVLVIKLKGETVYTRFNQEYYTHNFAYEDYAYAITGDIEVFYDLRETNRLQSLEMAANSLTFFIIVLTLIIAYLIFYSPHFALSVSDPIYVMKRGLAEPGYNLNVKIPQRYAEDDVYQLAALFNENYLPLKDLNRCSGEEGISSDISLDDYQDLIDGEDY